MTVIARKIAFARQSGPARPDADASIAHWLPDILNALMGWLSVEDLSEDIVTAGWSKVEPTALSGKIIYARGPIKDSHIILSVPEDLAVQVCARILSIDIESAPETVSALQSFIDQNTLELGQRISQIPGLLQLGGNKSGWRFETSEGLTDIMSAPQMMRIDMAYTESQTASAPITIIMSPNLIDSLAEDDDEAEVEAANDRQLSPRLGPCGVEVLAVADRVRMSVADCSRLEIGQVVALPGLRFDQLELTVEMGEGPVPLVDAALGADKGQKAVRLNRGLDPSFRTPPADLPRPVPSAVSV